MKFEVKPKRKYSYLEISDQGYFWFFSDEKHRGYKEITLTDLDNDCSLPSGKFRMNLEEMFEVEASITKKASKI